MRGRLLLIATLAVALAAIAAGCGGGGGTSSEETTAPAETAAGGETAATTAETGGETDAGEVVKGGILRVGTTSYIDSLNPFNWIARYGLVVPEVQAADSETSQILRSFS